MYGSDEAFIQSGVTPMPTLLELAERNHMHVAQFHNYLKAYKHAPNMFGGTFAEDLKTAATQCTAETMFYNSLETNREWLKAWLQSHEGLTLVQEAYEESEWFLCDPSNFDDVAQVVQWSPVFAAEHLQYMKNAGQWDGYVFQHKDHLEAFFRVHIEIVEDEGEV